MVFDDSPVGEVVEAFTRAWGEGSSWSYDPPPEAPHEAGLLMLDASLARRELGWRPRWAFDAVIGETVAWYKAWASGAGRAGLLELSLDQIDRHAAERGGR